MTTGEKPSAPREIYLGDGAYAKIERECIVVYTSNGVYSTNSIYLEPEVARNLLEYLKAVIG